MSIQKNQLIKTVDNNSSSTNPGFINSLSDLTAEDEYNLCKNKRKRNFILSICAISVIELGVGSGLLLDTYSNNLNKRTSREHEIRKNGRIELDTGTYVGETDFGFFNGLGDYTFDTGESYSGTWLDNKLNGSAIIRNPSFGVYDGDLINGQKSGYGTYTWDDNTYYIGEWQDDCMCGQGEYHCSKNTVYKGTFTGNTFFKGSCDFSNETGEYHLTAENGKLNKAEIVFSDGSEYNGEIKQHKLSGEGEFVFSNQDRYIGSFDAGKRSGSGTYYWASGDVYDGDWDNDALSGSGIYTFANGNTMQGTFSNNSFSDGSVHIVNDFGDYKFTVKSGEVNSVFIQLNDGTKYDGDVKDEKLSGQALITYSNGDKYDGRVVNGMKEGNGKYTWASQASYDGDWENDRMNGYGTYYYPTNEEGYKLVGDFLDGKPTEKCTYYVSSTEYYETEWENGVCVKVIE